MFDCVALALLYRRYAPGVADAAGGECLWQPTAASPAAAADTDAAAAAVDGAARRRRRLVSFWLLLMLASPITFCVFFNAGRAGSTMQPFTRHQARLEGGTLVDIPAFYPSLPGHSRSAALIAAAASWLAATLGLHLTCPLAFVPAGWHLPAASLPLLPAATVWLVTMLLGGFGCFPSDYQRVGYAVAAMTVLYLGYGVHASYYRTFGRAVEAAAAVSAAEEAAVKADDGPAVASDA